MSPGIKSGLLAAVCLAVLQPSLVHAQGFGKTKRKILLHRKLPAIAQLTGATFTVRVTARDPKHKTLASTLSDMVETEITRNDHRLSPEKGSADTVISCTINTVSTPPPTPVKRTVIDDNRPHIFMKVSGMLSVTYQARSKAGRLLDSENITAKFAEEYDDETGGTAAKTWSAALMRPIKKLHPGKPSDEEIMPQNADELGQVLDNRIAALIAMRLVNTDVAVPVFLAHGKGLDPAVKLAEAGLYSRMLESLETMQPFPKGEDDAYRIYDIGVAYEALAYQAEDQKTAAKFLDEAAISYGKAINARPGEKYFPAPQQRIDTAIAHFRKIQNQPVISQAVPALPPATAAGLVPAPASPPGGNTSTSMTNDQVVQLVKAGLSEDNVLAAVRSAKRVQFDLSAGAQSQLAESGVTNRVIAAMRDRTSAAPAATRRTTTTKPKTLDDLIGKQ